MSGMDAAAIRRRTPELLERVRLSDWADVRVKKFSKGMTQRLGLAAALVHDPDVLLLDEPTDGVDPVGRREIRDLLQEQAAQGKAILLNSHLLSEIERTCDAWRCCVPARSSRRGGSKTSPPTLRATAWSPPAWTTRCSRRSARRAPRSSG
jgi:ABC-2 type transport system ATP-binding protein